MERFLKKTLKSLMIGLLSIEMVVTSCLGFNVGVVFAEEEQKEDFNIVTIGDSITNGFGFDDYYPESGNPDSNVRGFEIEASEAFPHLLKEYFGKEGYNANLTQLAASAMRPEDLYAIMHPEFERDDYTNRVFTADTDHEKWISNWYNHYVGGAATKEQKESWAHDQFVNAIKDADLITYNLGINCFGTFLTARLPFGQLGIDGLNYGDTDDLQDLLDRSEIDINVEEKKQEVLGLLKEYVGIDATQYLGTVSIPGTTVEISVDEYVDLIVHAYCSFAIYFEKNIEDIRTLNPDARIVVMGLFNTQNDLYITLDGEAINIGDFYGKVLEMADIYMQVTQSSDQYAFVDTANLDIERFFDEIRNNEMTTSMRNRIIEQLFSLGVGEYLNTYLFVDLARLEDPGATASGYTIAKILKTFAKIQIDDPITVNTMKDAYNAIYVCENPEERINIVANDVNILLGSLSSIGSEDMSPIVTAAAQMINDKVTGDEVIIGLLYKVFDVLSEGANVNSISVEAILGVLLTAEDGAINEVANSLLSGELNDGTKGLINLFLRFMFADGICVHPNENGHITMANAIIDAYNSDVTARDGFSNRVIEKLEEYLPIASKELASFLEEEIANVDNISGASKSFIENNDKLVKELEDVYNSLAEKLTAITESADSAIENTMMTAINDAIEEVNVANANLLEVVSNIDFTKSDVENAVIVCKDAIANLAEVVITAQKQLESIKDNTDGELYEFLNASVEAMNKLVNAVDDYSLTSLEIFNDILIAIVENEEAREDYDYKEFVVDAVTKLVDKTAQVEFVGLFEVFSAQEELKAYLDELTSKYVLPALKEAMAAYKEGTEDAYDILDNATLSVLKGIYSSLDAIYADAAHYEEVCAKAKALYEEALAYNAWLKAEFEEQLNKIFKAIEELKECKDRSYEELVAKVREIDAAINDLCKKIEDKYNEVTEKINKIEAALAELDVAFNDSFAVADETIEKIKAEIAGIKSDVEFIKSVFEFMCDYAVNETYTVGADSYYVSLGDSIVTGFGFEEDGYKNRGYKTKVTSSFPYLLTEKLKLDPETQYMQLAMGGLRAEDILYMLDENYNADEYGKVVTANYMNEYGNGINAERETFKEELKKADFVTINMGGNNYGTFITSQINRYLNGEELWPMDFNRFGNHQELVELIRNAVHQNEAYFIASLEDSGLPVDEGTIDFAKLAEVYAEIFAYGTLGLLDTEWNVLDKIHEINPNTFIAVLGLYNTLDGVYVENYNIRIDLGKVVDVFKNIVNAYTMAYCGMHAKTVFVPIDEVEMISDSMDYSRNLLDGEFITNMTINNELDSHPSKNGHKYMAECVNRVIDRQKYTITYHKTSDEITGTDDGYQEIRIYDDVAEKLWTPNWTWTNKTFIGWEDADGNFYAKDEAYNNLTVSGNVDLYCVFVDSPRIKALSASFNESGVRVRAFGKGQINYVQAVVEMTDSHGNVETMGTQPMDGAPEEYFTTLFEYLNPDTQKLVVKVITTGNVEHDGHSFETSNEYSKEYTIADKAVNTLDVTSDMWYRFVDERNVFTYTGKSIKPQVEIYEDAKLLTSGKDYSLSYKNNKNVGKATITVTGKGNYSKSEFNKETIEFEIVAKDITDDDVTRIDLANVKASKKAQKLVPTITYGGSKLKENKDFVVTYEGEVFNGHVKATIEGKGNYTGTYENEYDVGGTKNITNAKVSKIASQKFTGEPITPEFTVTYKGKKLEPGSDYKVKFQNNFAVGKATVYIYGMGDYYGSITKTFKITGIALSKVKFLLDGESFKSLPTQTYDGAEKTISGISLYYQSNSKDPSTREDLIKDEDYTVTYQKNIDKGTATIVFTGINSYTGTVKKTFKITALPLTSLSSDKLTIDLEESYVYEKGGVKPLPTVTVDGRELVLNKDYTLSYKNNTAINDNSNQRKITSVTIKGKGNYAGTINKQFVVVQADVNNCGTITFTNKKWTTKKNDWKAAVVFKDVVGKQLKVGKDFTVKYINKSTGNEITETTLLPGTEIVVEITGIDNFKGTKCKEYIVGQLDISSLRVVVSPKEYTGREIRLSKDDISFYKGSKKVYDVRNEDFEIRENTYINNINKGSNAKVEIIGVNNCIGSKQVTFKIGAKGITWAIYQLEQLFND